MSYSAIGITVRAGRRALLNDVTIRIEQGELVAILGANGAGKSTLVRVLAGDLAPESGTVELDGRPLADWSLAERAQRRAILPQHSTVSFPFTAREVVLLGRTSWPEIRRRQMEIAEAALDAVGAASLSPREYPTLSGGERQRVHLARVLAQLWQPATACSGRYMVLDEPTSSLDLVHQRATLTTVRELARQGIGTLAILHDPNLAFTFSDRVIVLAAGTIVAEGKPREMADADVFRRAFGIEIAVIAHPVTGQPWVLPT